MLEKIARALADDDRRVSNVAGDDWLAMPKASRERYLGRARAAVEAMREPTEDMLRQGVGYSDWVMPEGMDQSTEGYRAEMRIGYQCMLDAILKEGGEG